MQFKEKLLFDRKKNVSTFYFCLNYQILMIITMC